MLAEKLGRFLKEKKRGVLRRGGESVLGAALNRLGREVVLSSHQECIVKIKLCSATKLGNHEIEGRENTDTKARLVDEIDGTVPVSRRHGDKGPTGKILGQIGRNVMGCEVVSQRHQWAVHFGGKIIPSGYSKTIQPYETGVIASIHIQDGQTVKQGDVLIELDATLNRADRDRAFNEYRAAKVEAARLRALVKGQTAFEAPPEADRAYVLLQQQLLRDQLAEYQAKVAAAQHLVDQRLAAIEQTRENILRLEATVPMEIERAEVHKRLLEHEAVSKMDFLQAEERRIDKVQELAGQKRKLQQDQAALAEAEKRYRAMASEFQQTKQAELSVLETKTASLAQEVTKAGQKAGLQRLTSPIDGVVQQLAVHTVGGVVTPAQQLLIVVSRDHPVEVEAQVENKDVGFVRERQPVEIKVETFPFTLYGTIPGHVLTVSDDAASVEKVGLVYPTRVNMDRSTIQVEGKQVNLSPGMAVTVEIKTGQRRIIEYLLSPLLKSMKESLRER